MEYRRALKDIASGGEPLFAQMTLLAAENVASGDSSDTSAAKKLGVVGLLSVAVVSVLALHFFNGERRRQETDDCFER